MHEIHSRPRFTWHQTFISVSVPDARPTIAQLVILFRSDCELRALFFVSSRYVYKFDYLPVMIHSINLHTSLTFYQV